MSLSFSNAKQKTSQAQQSQTDPWQPTKPLLESLLRQLDQTQANTNPVAQTNAINDLEATLKSGNPAAASYAHAGSVAANTPDYTPEVAKATGDLTGRLTATADGANLNLGENKYLQDLIQQTGNDAQMRVNAQFAGAGRDLSPGNNIEVGKGVTQATLPLLFNQYNLEQGRTDAAARDLHSAQTGDAGLKTNMDVTRADLAAKGAGYDAQAYSLGTDNQKQIADLETLKAQLPYQQYGWLTSLLYPAAGLGGQSTGEAQGVGSVSKIGGGITLADLGKLFTAPTGPKPA